MSETTTALAVAQPAGVAAMDATLQQWTALQGLAATLAKSGMMPKALSTPEAVLAVMLTGRELGMGPMEAARSLHYVEGRVVMDASAQLARALRAGVTLEWHASTAEVADVTMRRGGSSYRSTWTIAMAQRAGLAGRGTWRAHTEAMLRARAITAGIRAFCPDVLGAGVYSPDEAEDIRATATQTTTTPAAPSEPEPVAAEVVEGHHPTWDRDRGRFHAALGELGVDYYDLAAWSESLGRPRPSAMTTEQRGRLLDHVRGAKGRAALDAWVAKRAAEHAQDEAAAGREPGEE